MFCLKGDHPLVNQEYFRQSVVGGLDGSATFYNRTYLEFHRWIGGCRCEFRAIADLAIYLIARLVGIAIQIGEADRCRWNHQFLSVGHDGYLRHNRGFELLTSL